MKTPAGTPEPEPAPVVTAAPAPAAAPTEQPAFLPGSELRFLSFASLCEAQVRFPVPEDIVSAEITFFDPNFPEEEKTSSIPEAAIASGEYRAKRETYSPVREAHPEFYADPAVESTLSVRVTITHADGRVETLFAERPAAQRFAPFCSYNAESDTVSVYLFPIEADAIPDAVVGKDLSAPDERTVSVGYDADLRAVEAVIADALPAMFEENRAVFLDVPQYIGVEELGESGVVLKFIVSATEENVFAARRALNRSLKLLFDEKGIDIPYPQLTVHTK